jgi:hypothetical protein
VVFLDQKHDLCPASDKHQNPSKMRVFNRPIPQGFFPGGIVRAGLYARVSTHDQQTLPLQLAAMHDYVSKRGWKTALEIQDVGSGASLRHQREELLKAARRRELDRIVVWRLERWERSLLDLVSTLQELASMNVGFFSLTEALDLAQRPGYGRYACSICGVRRRYIA